MKSLEEKARCKVPTIRRCDLPVSTWSRCWPCGDGPTRCARAPRRWYRRCSCGATGCRRSRSPLTRFRCLRPSVRHAMRTLCARAKQRHVCSRGRVAVGLDLEDGGAQEEDVAFAQSSALHTQAGAALCLIFGMIYTTHPFFCGWQLELAINIVRCPSCGNSRRMHHLCRHCLAAPHKPGAESAPQ